MKFTFLMKYVPKLKNTKKKTRFAWTLDENKYLTLSEVLKLKRFCVRGKNNSLSDGRKKPIRDWFMVELGLNAGLRVKEMASLKCRDLLIVGEQSAIIAIGKRSRKRRILINSRFKNTCLWFLKWKKENNQPIDPDAFVFVSENNMPISRRMFQKAFKECIVKSGLPSHYSIHCLRHTYASHLYIASRHNLRLVQEQLGHSSVKVTEVYASLMSSESKIAVERLYR